MSKNGEIKVVMTLDRNDFTVQMVKAGDTIREFKKNVEQTSTSVKNIDNHLNSFGHRMRDLTLSASLARYALTDIHDLFLRLPMGILKTAGEIERLQTLMRGLSKETDEYAKKAEAARNVKFVFNLAQNAPFEVKALSDAFVKLKTAGLDPTRGSLQALTDSVAKFGGTSDRMHRASIAIQQMAGKGVVSMEELRQQLGEAVPNAIQLMAQGMGLSMAELVKRVSKGIVESKDALSKMLWQMKEENRGAAAAMMDTWGGMVEQFKTKWVILQNDIANSGFFDAAKEELRGLNESFNSDGIKEFARTVGSALKSVVDTIVWAKNLITQYGGEIYALFIGLFVTKMASIIGPFETTMTRTTAAFKAAITEKDVAAKDALVRQKILIQQEIAANEARVVATQTQTAKEVQIRSAAFAEQVRIQAKLNQLQATAPGWSQAKIARLEAELLRQKELFAEMQKSILARNADANATRVQTQASELKIIALNSEIAQTTRLTVAQQALTGVKAVLTGFIKTATTAIKGFALSMGALALQMAAIVLVVEGVMWVWNKLGEEAEKTAKRVNDAKEAMRNYSKGVVNEGDDVKVRADNDVDTATLKRLKFEQKNLTGYSKEFLAARDAEIAELQKKVDKQDAALKDIDAKVRQNGFTDVQANYELQLNRITQDAIAGADKRAALREQEIALEEERADKGAAGQKKLTEKKNEIRQRYIDINTDLEKKALKKELDARTRSILDREAGLVKMTDAEFAKEVLRQKAVSAKYDNLVKDSAKNRIDPSSNVYMGDKGAGKGKGAKIDREDPILMAIEDQKSKLAIASLEMDKLIADAGDYQDKKAKAAIEILGNVAEGKYDSKNVKDGKTVSVDYMGASQGVKSGESPDVALLERRKQLVADLTAALATGKITVDEFIQSDNGLTEADKKHVAVLVDVLAKNQERTALNKAMLSIDKEVISAQNDYAVATENFSNGGLAKMTAGMKSLTAKVEEERAALKRAGSDLAEYDKKARAAFEARAGADAKTWGATQEQELLKAQIAGIDTVSEKQKAAHEASMTRIQAEFDLNLKALEGVRAARILASEDTTKIDQEIADLHRALTNGKLAEDLNYYNTTKSEFQKVLDSWSDTTAAMDKASANWANNFVDMVVDATNTGKLEFGNFIKSILNDLKKMAIQGTFAALMKGAFGANISFGGAGGAVASVGSQAVSGIQNSVIGQAVSSAVTSTLGTVGGWVTGIGGSLAGGVGGWMGAMATEGIIAGTIGSVSAGVTALVSGNIMGAVGSLLGPIGLLVGAISLLGIGKGETRAGGQYGYSMDGTTAYNARRDSTVVANGIGATFLEGPSGGDPYRAQASAAINGTVSSTNALLKTLGSKLTVSGFQAGYETSGKGRGGVFSGGTLSSGVAFGESGKGDNYNGTLYETTSTQSPGAEDAIKNFGTDLIQVTVQALQAATDLPAYIKKMLVGVNAELMTSDEATQLLTNIQSIGLVMTALGDTIPGFAESVAQLDATVMMENINSVATLINTGFLADFAVIEEAVSHSSDTLWDSYTQQTRALGPLISGYDGTAASAAALAGGLNTLGQTTMSVLQAIKGASADTHTSITDSIRSMRLSVLDEKGKYEFIERETVSLRAKLATALDPTEIASYANQIRQNAMDNFALIPESQRAAYLEQYEQVLTDTDTLAQERYNVAKEQIKADRLETSTAITSAIGTAVDNWIAAQGPITAAQQSAANTQLQAANTPISVQVNVNPPPAQVVYVQNEVGGGGS